MFGLFKRNIIEEWEVQLLKSVLSKLPIEYSNLVDQINDGLLKGVILNATRDIPGYVAFTYHSNVFEKYVREAQRSFKITNIKIYESKISSFVSYEIYILSGVISGYLLNGGRKCSLDVSNIDSSCFRKEFIGEYDYNRIEKILSKEERDILNKSSIYSVFIKNKEYFSIKDLEDGDFIGIDFNKIVYKITHNPVKVIVLDKSIIEVLSTP